MTDHEQRRQIAERIANLMNQASAQGQRDGIPMKEITEDALAQHAYDHQRG
jgi:hypothetical protein